MKYILVLLIISFFGSNFSYCQDWDSQYVEKGFLIILSTKDYDSALKRAEDASEQLGLDFKTRGYYPDEESGLKSDEVCGCGESHGYIARGRYDDGEYVSIEYSSSFKSFADGYYIVILASGRRKDLKPFLTKVKAFYNDAYIKNSKVYIGCMH